MNYNEMYDKKNPESIVEYASCLVGKTFYDVIEYAEKNETALAERVKFYGNAARKGGLGNLLEELYFGYKANSNQEADFNEAGVELKATPYEYTKKGELRAGERLVCARPADMYSDLLKEQVRYFKETKGGQSEMCELIENAAEKLAVKMAEKLAEEMAEKLAEEKAEKLAEEKAEKLAEEKAEKKRMEIIAGNVKRLTKNAKMTVDVAFDTLEVSGKDREMILKML